jgi:hypothetical protein
MLILPFVMALSQGAAAVASTAPTSLEGPLVMSSAEVRAHNANLKRDDPNFIRCIHTQTTGSLVKKRAACRTNASWHRIDELGGRQAREFVDSFSKGYNRGN